MLIPLCPDDKDERTQVLYLARTVFNVQFKHFRTIVLNLYMRLIIIINRIGHIGYGIQLTQADIKGKYCHLLFCFQKCPMAKFMVGFS